MTDTAAETDVAGGFAELMNKAAEQGAEEREEAPYGYTRDPATGEERPKKTAGRPRKPPALEELRELQAEGDGAGETPADRAPDEKRRLTRRRKSPDTAPAPAYKPGVITSGVNRLYRRAGKIVRAMDSDIGTAILEAAKNTAGAGEPDDSVGAAWEELARTNPRVRKFVMKCLAGGAWTQLVMAHAPIAMAIMMKPAILRLIPFRKLVESMAEPDEDTPEGEGGLPGGMTADDARQMADLAQAQLAKMGLSVPPEVAGQMAQMAGSMMAGGAPPGSTRAQPKRTTRAQRKG